MANPEHVEILRNGVWEWNKWRADSPEMDPDLSRVHLIAEDLNGANLSSADLSRSNLSSSDLGGADLSKANLYEADLSSTNLFEADLSGANLRSALLSGAFLVVANLSSAQLGGADLSGADLGCTNFAYANFGRTQLCDVNLSEALGLETALHLFPSSVGIDTIYKSKGKIPETFLRGAGVPESLLNQIHSLVNAEDGIQFYSCFISYSSKDEEFAKRLHGKMRDAHLRVWFAPEDIQGGKKLHEQIETAIRVYDKLLIVLSEASLQSEWVMTELRRAQDKIRLRQQMARNRWLPRAD